MADTDKKEAVPYTPSEDEKKLISTIEEKFEKWRTDRRPYERKWYINAAFYMGRQDVQWDNVNSKLLSANDLPAPSHRVRLYINRIFPKMRSRRAKFLKNRPIPVVVPASTDREDRLDAKATEKALGYLWRKENCEQKFADAIDWASITGKGFWWFYWNAEEGGRVALKNPETGEIQQVADDVKLGDVVVEVGTPFEVLVSDITKPRLRDQAEIMRVRLRDINEVKGRYPKSAKYITPSENYQEVFYYENRISSLQPIVDNASKGDKSHVLVKELFVRPTVEFPKGRYLVLAGNVLVRQQDELPYNMWKDRNCFPVIEFRDTSLPTSFWPPTVLEQLIDIQREYNLIRSKVAEHLRLMIFPKLLVAKQHQLPDGAWSSEGGEIVEYVALPGVPPPTPFVPPNIASDAWRALEALREEFEAITQIYPSSEGQVGGAESGFQTNLLQEAADSAHQPDIRSHEISIEEAAFKMRKLMKNGYTVPRLLTIVGRNYEPEVMEFSAEEIDENADIVVQVGSALPTLKAARIQSILELWDRGVLGDQNDPEAKRRTLSLLDLGGGVEESIEIAARDENLARLENAEMLEQDVEPPQFYQNHMVHYTIHSDDLKTPEARKWPEEVKFRKIVHLLLTLRQIDPMGAWQAAAEYGLQGVIPPPPGLMAPPGMPPGPPGAPPQGGMPPPPMPPGMPPPGMPPMMPPMGGPPPGLPPSPMAGQAPMPLPPPGVGPMPMPPVGPVGPTQ